MDKDTQKEQLLRELRLNRKRNPNDPYLIQLKMAARKAGLAN